MDWVGDMTRLISHCETAEAKIVLLSFAHCPVQAPTSIDQSECVDA